MNENHLPERRQRIRRWQGGDSAEIDEILAREEPLEILCRYAFKQTQQVQSLGWTLRTPGHDRALAAGLLYGEGWVNETADIIGFHEGTDRVEVQLANQVEVPEGGSARRLTRSGACGFCGRAELLRRPLPLLHGVAGRVPVALLYSLPDRLRQQQPGFANSGGVHAAGLFTETGECLGLFEDVGRHNAVDKLVGAQLLAGALPTNTRPTNTLSVDASAPPASPPLQLLALSGRAGFELLQKAAAAGFALVVALGAPTTLAVELAAEQGITLCGFTRADRCNVYTHTWRVTR